MNIIYFGQSRLFARRRFLQLPTPAYGHESRLSSERNNDYGSLIARAGAEKPAEDRGVRRSPLPRVRRGQRLGSRGHERRGHDDRRLLQAFRIEGRPGRGGLLSDLRSVLDDMAPGFRTQIRRSGPPIGRHRRLLSEEERGRSGLSDDRLRAPRDDRGRRRVFTRILQDRDGSPVLAVSRSHGQVPQGALRGARSGSQGPVRGDDRSETPRPIGGGRGMDSFAEERREG